MKREWDVEISIEDLIDELHRTYENDYGYATFEISTIENLIKSIKSKDIEIITGGRVYWSGILFLEPWDEVMESLEIGEEEIIDLIIENHITIENHKILFKENNNSELQYLFDKYADGYGGNIPHNIETIINRILDAVKLELDNNLEDYGSWFDY